MSKHPFGVLLLHGFTSNPENFREFAPRINALGVPYRVPCLPGHGAETPEALKGVRWQSWVEAAAQSLEDLLQEADKAIIVGHSLGGWIAVHLAADYPERVDSIVLAGSTLQMTSPFAPGRPFNWLVPLVIPLIPRWDLPPVYTDTKQAEFEPGYRWAPTEVFAELFAIVRATQPRLAQVHVPVLVLHSRRDSTTSPAAVLPLLEGLGTPASQKRLVWFEKTEHEMFLDCERDAVSQAILTYVRERMAAAVPLGQA